MDDGDFILATALGIAAGVVELAIRLARRKPVGTMTWVSLGLVVATGGASIFTHQPLFMGAVMLMRGWMYE